LGVYSIGILFVFSQIVNCAIEIVFVTHLVWPHWPENPPGRRRARHISLRRNLSLFPLFYSTTS